MARRPLSRSNPGASGISDIPSAPIEPVAPTAEPDDRWTQQEWPAEPVADEQPRWHLPVESSERPVPTDTSSFFAAKAQSTPPPPPPPQPEPMAASTPASDDAIYQNMLSEWLIDDPFKLANSTNLDWQTVWESRLVGRGRSRGSAHRPAHGGRSADAAAR